MRPYALLALFAIPVAYAQTTTTDTGLPNLSTVGVPSGEPSSTSSSSTSSAATTQTTGSSTTTAVQGVLSNAPTIAGAGVPTIIIPYTANAPFMQKSDLPEGTVFIAVGAVLAFLGACVLLWRASVAWSMNRSVKRAALASVRGTEKLTNWAPSGYSNLSGGKNSGYYKEYQASSMSLDALTSSGKNIEKAHTTRSSAAAPPAGLFFSPTAQAQQARNTPSPAYDPANRSSTHLPAGYYASPSADRPASGANFTTVGGSLAPYASHHLASQSPPQSPDLAPVSRSTATYYNNNGSRDGLRPISRDGLSRDGYGPAPRNMPSHSSLSVGLNTQSSNDNLPGSRAPSAYLDNLFENHGNGPRERF